MSFNMKLKTQKISEFSSAVTCIKYGVAIVLKNKSKATIGRGINYQEE